MPAGLPGDSYADGFGNPNEGDFVIMDPLSGPKGSPFDYDGVTLSWDANNHPVYTVGDPQNTSTGGLSTGIGFGSQHIIGVGGIALAGFVDDYTPGVTMPDGTTAQDESVLMYIGGGKSEMDPPVGDDATDYSRAASVTTPYATGFEMAGAGNGGSRDSGANTGFGMKMVTTAADDIANGAVIETGFVNRSGETILDTGQSAFGSAVAPIAAPT